MSGKRDRPKDMQLDEHTLEYKKVQQPNKDDNAQSREKISQRTIYKIKASGEQNRKPFQSKTKFTLLSSAQKKDVEQDQKPKDQQNKESKQKQQQKKGETVSQSLETKKEVEKKPNIFNFSSNIFNGVGIFSNNNNNQVTNKNIFGTHGSIPTKTYSNNPASSNGSSQGKTQNIFGTIQSVFNFASNGAPPIKNQVLGTRPEQKQQDDGDSAQLEKDQLHQIDKTKSTGNFEYKSDCETLFQNKATKVKKHNGELVENIEVLIQQDLNKTISWMTIRLAATKNSIVTGYLVKGKSEVKRIGNKDENVTVSVLVKKDETHQSQILKIQFQKPEEGKNFLETVQKLIK